jgi:DNA-binding transcriptional LysR family regulator
MMVMPGNTDLRKIDLNLLVIFGVLFRTRNTTRAAEQLNLTQPAVSNALKRLREQFGEVLFVRTATGMEPTPRAEVIARLLEEGFASIRLAVQAAARFDPATVARTFNLYVSDIGQSVFIPPLAARLRQTAPLVRLNTHYVPLEAAQQMMKLGQIDLAIGNFTGFHADFIQQTLFDESYAVLVRSKHPTIGATISIDEFFAAKHIDYKPSTGSHAYLRSELESMSVADGRARHVTLSLAHLFGIGQIVASSDLIACVPSRVAAALARSDDVRAVAFPRVIPIVNISQFWHERCHRDEGHQWLRSLVYEMFSDRLSAPSSDLDWQA